MSTEHISPQFDNSTSEVLLPSPVIPIDPTVLVEGLVPAELEAENESTSTDVTELQPRDLGKIPEIANISDIRATVASVYSDASLEQASTLQNDSDPVLEIVGDTPLRVKGKTEKEPKYSIRKARPEDIPTIVDVDMKAFSSVYSEYGDDQVAMRDELIKKFQGRYEKVGGGWMPVLEKDGEIVGFMTCCPTSKTPEDFKSWEETTDNGTLENTYDPDGKNVYVVTLDVLPEGTAGKDMLFANQIGKMMRDGKNQGFFESRMPGLRASVEKQCEDEGIDVHALSGDELDSLAQNYFEQKVEINGKVVRKDRLIRLYEKVGCKVLSVVPNAYKDYPSMDYGAVCVYDGLELFDGSVLAISIRDKVLPIRIPDNRVTRKLFGVAIMAAAHSQKITSKFFK